MQTKYFKDLISFNSYINKFKKKCLNILSVNIRSVSSICKFNKFKYELSKMARLPDIIAVQETWFNEKLVNLYSIPGYEVVHCCRKDGYGGNSVYIKSSINYIVKIQKSEDYLDVVSIVLTDIKINNKPLVLTSIYRSQKCVLENFLMRIEHMLDLFNGAPCFIVGDCNIDVLSDNRTQRQFLNLFSEFNMHSCHNLITRPQGKTSIDCVFTNIDRRVFVNSIENDLSDHNMISCSFESELLGEDIILEKCPKINYEKLGRYLEYNLQSSEVSENSSDACEQLIDMFKAASMQSTTTINKSSSTRKKLTPWISDNLLSLICYKDKLLKSRRKNRDNKILSERLRRISKVIKVGDESLMNGYYNNNLKACNGDPRKTWLFLNKEFGRNNRGIRQIELENGQVLMQDEEKATALNDFFINITNHMQTNNAFDPSDNINIFHTLIPERTIFTINKVDKIQIVNILDKLKNNKSPGYDNITPKMLLIKKDPVADKLTYIFNKMIEVGSYPDCLKIHKIIPIPKTRGSNNIANFRPISLLSVVDKILEKLIFEQLSNYLDSNKILFERQFGFKKGSGTEDAIVNVIDFVCGELDAGYSGVAGVFFDYSKAFDLVNHDILIRKLRVIGLSENTLKIFRSYLSSRMQFVQVGESKSATVPVNCGVPQGSVLGPLLFKIFVNDMKNINFKGRLFMYADDVCLFYKYNHSQVLKTQIEYDAAILAEFSRCNKLFINPGKTQFIRFKPYISRSEEKMSVHVDGTVVTESDMVKYLGVVLNHNLLWDEHINMIKTKIASGIGILRKFKNKLNSDTKLLIYQSLVHSHLTYGISIYGCKFNNTLKSLQSAQNKALKLVFNVPVRYSTLDLFKTHAKNILPIRGLYKQKVLLYVFKTIRTNSHHLVQFTNNLTRTQRVTRQSANLSSVRCRLDLTKQRISYAGPHEYNNLPVTLRNIQTISTFKSEIKNYLLQNLETLLM